jgi:hypothetical protein
MLNSQYQKWVRLPIVHRSLRSCEADTNLPGAGGLLHDSLGAAICFFVAGNAFSNNASFLVHFSLGIPFSGMRKFLPMSL